MTDNRPRKKAYTPKKDDEEPWQKLGLGPELIGAVNRVWKGSPPTPIQCRTIPVALTGADIIGIAETGSGKTGAFVLPTLQQLLKLHSDDESKAKQLYAICLAPTRELVVQISTQFSTLGEIIDLRVCTLIGGTYNMIEQTKAIARNPHVIVASPGRIIDHINNTKGFKKQLITVRTLIFDEADRLLSLDFEDELNVILGHMNRKNRPQTYLFSATMTENVEKLERVAMSNAVTVKVADINTTPETLVQWMKVLPSAEKINFLAALMERKKEKSMIIFCNNTTFVIQLHAFLCALQYKATCIYGKLHQADRLKNLDKFTSNKVKILVTTEVSSRGLDIQNVDFVLNFDVPMSPKDYMHRVGRTARAGKHGETLMLVTQYDLETFVAIEDMLFPEVDGERSGRIEPYDEIDPEEYENTEAIDKVQSAWAEAQAQTAEKKEVIHMKNHHKKRKKNR